jgi:predicted secreted protein
MSKTFTVGGEPVDITSDDDGGYRTLLAEAGVKTLDISFEGVTKNNDLRSAILTGLDLMLTDISLEFPNGDTIAVDFFFTSLEETGAHNDAVKFSGSMQSSGEWTYTPAP